MCPLSLDTRTYNNNPHLVHSNTLPRNANEQTTPLPISPFATCLNVWVQLLSRIRHRLTSPRLRFSSISLAPQLIRITLLLLTKQVLTTFRISIALPPYLLLSTEVSSRTIKGRLSQRRPPTVVPPTSRFSSDLINSSTLWT